MMTMILIWMQMMKNSLMMNVSRLKLLLRNGLMRKFLQTDEWMPRLLPMDVLTQKLRPKDELMPKLPPMGVSMHYCDYNYH
jgi:hypothetical protein